MQHQLKSGCNNFSPSDTGDGEEKVISQGKCILYLVALLEAWQAIEHRETLLIKINEPDHIFKSSEPLCLVSHQ